MDGGIKVAADFLDAYYGGMDGDRATMAPFYTADTSIVWCGNAGRGVAQASSLLRGIPKSKHAVTSFDVQPSAAVPGGTALLVAVRGTVAHGSDKPRIFSQTFLLARPRVGGAGWTLLSDCFRYS